MELTGPHILGMLDRIRETQHEQNRALLRIIQDQREVIKLLREVRSSKKGSPPMTLPEFLKPTVRGAAQWAAGLLTLAYISQGGDLMAALKALAAFF